MGFAWLTEWRARPLLLIALALATGEWLMAGRALPLPQPFLLSLLLLLLLLAYRALARRSAWAFALATTLAAGLFGAMRLATSAIPQLAPHDFCPALLDHRSTVLGQVLKAPERAGESAEFVCELLARRTTQGADEPLSGRLLIHLSPPTPPGPLPLAGGECFQATLTPHAFTAQGLPGETPRWREAYAERIYAEAWLPEAARLTPVACPGERRGLPLFESQRSAFANWLDVSLPRAPAEILKSLSIGMGRGLPPELRQSFQQAGISHVLSISGLHVAVLCFLLFAAARLLLRRSIWLLRRVSADACAAGLTLPLVWAYAALAGMGAPVWRSALMISVFLMGRVLARRADALNSLALAVTAILLISPTALFDLGFRLSVASVLALILGMGRLWRLLPKAWRGWLRAPGIERRMLRATFEVMGGTILCWLATLPFVAPAFHQVAMAAFWANLLFVPLYTWLILPLLALVQAFFAFGLSWADTLLALLDTAVMALLRAQNALLAVAGSWVQVPPQPGPAWALLLLALLAASQAFYPLRGLRGRPDLPLYPDTPARLRWFGLAFVLLVLALGASALAWRQNSIPASEAGVWLLPSTVSPLVLSLRPEGAELLAPGRAGQARSSSDQQRLLALLEGLGLTRLDRLWLLSAGRDEWSAAFALSARLPVGELLDKQPASHDWQCQRFGRWRRCLNRQRQETIFENRDDARLGLRWRHLLLSFDHYTLLLVSQPWRMTALDWALLLPFAAGKPLALVFVGVPSAQALDGLAEQRLPEALAFALTTRHGQAFGQALWRHVLDLFGVAARTDRDGVLHIDAAGRLWARGRRFTPLPNAESPEP